MLSHAVMFLVVGLMVGALNLAGVPSVAVRIPWNLFLIGTLLVSIYVVAGRTVQVAWLGAVRLSDGFRRDDLVPTYICTQGGRSDER
jgi:uncharacterized membrane protein YtjA (UPF0391 family)